jgi:VWFA-related protein
MAKRGWSAAWSVAALALTLAGSISAQAKQSVQSPDGSRDSAAAPLPPAPPIRVDAIVTDTHGRPVLDLRPSDFELRVNGVTQPLAGVEVRSPPRRSAAPVAETDGAVAAAAHPGTRVFAFLLDEFHVGAGAETARVKETLSHFIDRELRPSDLAVIVKPLDSVNTIRFTRDRDAMRVAVASFAGRKEDLTPRSSFEEQFIGHAPAAVVKARAQIVTVALTEMALQLGELSADRAAVVFVSEGFTRPAGSRRTPRMPDLQGLLRAASRFHFALYAFNPAVPAGPQHPDVRDPSAATLEWLAKETGGAAVLDGSGLTAGLRRMSAELDAYYALTLPPGVADGRFYPIDVRTKRAGTTVRVRPGYWAPLSSEVREWLARASNPLPPAARRALRRSVFIEAFIGVVPSTEARRQLVVSWEAAPRSVAVRARPEAARVELTARSASGETLFEGTVSRGGAATPGARFDVPSGRIELDMRVFGANGALLDSDIRDYTVPDLHRADASVVLAPQVIRTRTMNEFRGALANPDAVPTAARSFARSERLVLRVPAWSPSGEAVQVRVQVLNRMAQPMRTVDPVDASAGVAQFGLPLTWLSPGEYYLEFTGRSGGGNARERIAFRVTG